MGGGGPVSKPWRMTSSPHVRARRVTLSALSAVTVAATLAAVAPALPSHAAPATAPAGPAPLDWRPCPVAGGPGGQECADLPVPLDHADPEGPRITIAVTRVASEDPSRRRGTLLVVPGGPGGSGVKRLTGTAQALRTQLGDAYDLVAFDPRGVGGSSRAGCGIAAEDRHLVTLRSWPAADGSVTGNAARSRRIAEACRSNGGALVRSFSTANEVRDLEHLRLALGEDRLSVWGTSYGAYVTAVYAQKYPRRTDRVVLDSTGDPDPAKVARGWLADIAPAAALRFPDFAAWAADPAREEDGLRTARRPEDVEPLFLALAERLDRQPRRSATPGVPLTGARLRQALQNALYDDDLFPGMARLLLDAQDPGATPVLPGDLAGPLPDEDAAVTVATICNDVAWPRPVAAYARAVAEDRRRHPLTDGMPVNVVPCAFWKTPPADAPIRITDEGPSNILMIQNRRDPATPHFGALAMREALGDRARLVTVDRGGHGVYLNNGNACGDSAVTAFLTGGRRPAHDIRCEDRPVRP